MWESGTETKCISSHPSSILCMASFPGCSLTLTKNKNGTRESLGMTLGEMSLDKSNLVPMLSTLGRCVCGPVGWHTETRGNEY